MGHYISINCDTIESIVLNCIAIASVLAPGMFLVSSAELEDTERAVIHKEFQGKLTLYKQCELATAG